MIPCVYTSTHTRKILHAPAVVDRRQDQTDKDIHFHNKTRKAVDQRQQCKYLYWYRGVIQCVLPNTVVQNRVSKQIIKRLANIDPGTITILDAI